MIDAQSSLVVIQEQNMLYEFRIYLLIEDKETFEEI
jgi:hypothetical protein